MTTPAHAKLKKLWDVHQERVLPKIIDYSGASTEELRADLDAYDRYCFFLLSSLLSLLLCFLVFYGCLGCC